MISSSAVSPSNSGCAPFSAVESSVISPSAVSGPLISVSAVSVSVTGCDVSSERTPLCSSFALSFTSSDPLASERDEFSPGASIETAAGYAASYPAAETVFVIVPHKKLSSTSHFVKSLFFIMYFSFPYMVCKKTEPLSHRSLIYFATAPLYKNVQSRYKTFVMMRITGLEPARHRHQNLNLARLPIPPYPLMNK